MPKKPKTPETKAEALVANEAAEEEVVEEILEEEIIPDEELTEDLTPGEAPSLPTPKTVTRKNPREKDTSVASILPKKVIIERETEEPELEEEMDDMEDDLDKVTTAETKPERAVKVERIDPDEAREDRPVKEGRRKNQGGRFGWSTVLILFLLGALGWGLFVKAQYYPEMAWPWETAESGQLADAPEPTESPASPTTVPVNRAEVALTILNGAGVSGAAGSTAEALEELGYTIISVGNASRNDLEITLIEVSEELAERELEALLADLEDEYGSASVSGTLEETATVSARITLGQDWYPRE